MFAFQFGKDDSQFEIPRIVKQTFPGSVNSSNKPLPAEKGLGGVRRKGANRGPKRMVTPPFFVHGCEALSMMSV